MRRRAPVPLSGAIEALTKRLEPDTPLASIQRAWPAAVGETIAAETELLSERAGVVTVFCASTVWAQELSFMAADFADRVNGVLGAPRVTEIKFTSRRKFA